MNDFESREYRIFEMFRKQNALVTVGNINRFNTCTIGWGSLGTLWTKPGKSGSIVTVYLYPTRYTTEFMLANVYFTVCFFAPEYKKALGILGSLSGRDSDKVAVSGLTPVDVSGSVGFKEASLTLLCRKMYSHRMIKEELPEDIREYYASNPKAYPPCEDGQWQPHLLFIGEIMNAIDKCED